MDGSGPNDHRHATRGATPQGEDRQRLAAQLVRARAMLATADEDRARVYVAKLVHELEARIAALDAPAAPPGAAARQFLRRDS